MRELVRDGVHVLALPETPQERMGVGSVLNQVANEQGWSCGDLVPPATGSLCIAVLWEGEVIGGIDVRLPGPLAMPILQTWPELGPLRLCEGEVIVLALKRSHRFSTRLLWVLSAEVWRQAKEVGLNRLFLEATYRSARLYARLGWSLEPVGPEREHWGEPCRPYVIELDKAEAKVRARLAGAQQLGSVLRQADRP